MPVSRKRRKPGKPGKAVGQGPRSLPPGLPELRFPEPENPARELLELFSAMKGDKRHPLDDQRVASAKPMMTRLVSELVADADADGLPGTDLEDALCERWGPLLFAAENRDVAEGFFGPTHAMEALIKAAAAAVRDLPAGPVESTGAWRVFTTVAGVAPETHREQLKAELRDLRKRRRPPVPALPAGPVLAGDVLWARDRYGSRIGVIAPFATAGEPRWYLWDLDGCGKQVFAVHSGYHATPADALTEWRRGVGDAAAGDAQWSAIDDPATLDDVLPRREGLFRMGGEPAAQFAEYHRGRRLAELVRARHRRPEPAVPGLDSDTAAEEFAAWLRVRRPDIPVDGLAEKARELADSWRTEASSLYATFSAHRVALNVAHMRNFYTEDYVAELVALQPDWITWLGERAGADIGLVERSLAYAGGAPYPGIVMTGPDADYHARVIE
ncbi:hypothetical protein J2S43_008109 [Catenuloplanes nepalensis]|uniref:Uncharacterized protein n=1 Tax=Catenuloplanes nepalensis TaxID=587533 RepID=A0ABT9N7C0_9ACTN|nr:hypothetical protein [Catenuloplanes nepalensis]MDP9799597.1 hypothetical protein [Catenuloplanes nepalensis]